MTQKYALVKISGRVIDTADATAEYGKPAVLKSNHGKITRAQIETVAAAIWWGRYNKPSDVKFDQIPDEFKKGAVEAAVELAHQIGLEYGD